MSHMHLDLAGCLLILSSFKSLFVLYTGHSGDVFFPALMDLPAVLFHQPCNSIRMSGDDSALQTLHLLHHMDEHLSAVVVSYTVSVLS